MRKESGAEHIFTDTDAYDDAGKRWDRETEVWIPFKDKPCGTPCPRSEALANRVTFKLRVQEDKQEEGWKMLHTRKPPPSQKWMLGKVRQRFRSMRFCESCWRRSARRCSSH